MNYLKTAFFTLALSCAGIHTSHAVRLVPECVAQLFKKQIKQSKETRIGVIKLLQHINYESAESVMKKIIAFSEDEKIKGVLLVMNSGGGEAGPGELLFREIKKLASKKPVVVIVTSVCGSGAYMAAVGANWIITPGLAIVGSIGVVQTIEKHKKPRITNNQGYSANLEYDLIYAGKYKVAGSNNTAPLDKETRKIYQATIDNTYQSFLAIVAQQRNLPLETSGTWADGKVFSGDEALKIGLVDQIGGYSDAVEKLKELIEKDGPLEDKLVFVE